MKFTKLSLVAALAISSAFAGGDIAPVEPAVEAPAVEEACNANTTVDGKATLYYITADGYGFDLFDEETSMFGAAATVNVAHKITDNVTANFTAVGFTNFMDINSFEDDETGAYFNVANITASYGDTTLVAGRQLLGTPMLQGYDWLLAPGAFEAYTLVNTSIPDVTLVAAYVDEWRPNNGGVEFLTLDGDNWTASAAYAGEAFSASAWYYNVDALGYTQVYVDASTKVSDIEVAAQYAYTDWDAINESNAFGIMASTEISDIALMAAYNYVDETPVGYVGWNGLYTNSWNTTVANSVGNSFKVEAATEISEVSVTASYAYYEYDQLDEFAVAMEDGHEFDLILGYGLTNCISLDAIYSNTDYGDGENINQLELIATYKF